MIINNLKTNWDLSLIIEEEKLPKLREKVGKESYKFINTLSTNQQGTLQN